MPRPKGTSPGTPTTTDTHPMNATEFPTIRIAREALQALISTLQDLVETLDTTPEPECETWTDDDCLGEFLDRSCTSTLSKDKIRSLVNLGLVL